MVLDLDCPDVLGYDGRIAIQLGEHNVWCREQGHGGPIICWGTFSGDGQEFDSLWKNLTEGMPEKAFVLCAFTVPDWNRDFSPWQAPAAWGEKGFGGRGRETLDWLMRDLLPQMEERFGGQRKRFLIGYSLAGLFALWAGYEEAGFDGLASCSGSVWFDEWDTYVRNHDMKSPCKVYLSLGGKEEKTKNAAMGRVGVRTREQEKILKADPMVSRVILEWNSGGHFADSAKRLAKGIRWLLCSE